MQGPMLRLGSSGGVMAQTAIPNPERSPSKSKTRRERSRYGWPLGREITLLLVGGTAVSTWRAWRATRAESLAVVRGEEEISILVPSEGF